MFNNPMVFFYHASLSPPNYQSLYHPNPNYMSLQPHINHRMRSILIDWLVLVQVKFNLLHETLYLTVSIIDRYLQVNKKHSGR